MVFVNCMNRKSYKISCLTHRLDYLAHNKREIFSTLELMSDGKLHLSFRSYISGGC